MKYAKILSLGLVAFVLLGCNQAATTVVDDTVEAATPQEESEESAPQQIPQKIVKNKPSIQNGIIDETSYQSVSKSLESITKGCKETKKTGEYSQYKICKKGNRIVNASEYASEAGAGLAYWLAPNGKVVAIRNLSSGVLSIFDSNGKVSSQFDVYNSKKIKNIDAQERKNLEQNVYNGYQQIIAAFNNNSSTKAPSQSSIIDETSFQTVSKSLESITKGCTKSKKTEDNLNFEICKKGDKVVSATEYAPEADAGSTYWFSPDGKLVAMRYFSSGDTYVFDSNYKVSSKFNVYESKKVDKITADERKRIEEDSYFSYRRILDVFNL